MIRVAFLLLLTVVAFPTLGDTSSEKSRWGEPDDLGIRWETLSSTEQLKYINHMLETAPGNWGAPVSPETFQAVYGVSDDPRLLRLSSSEEIKGSSTLSRASFLAGLATPKKGSDHPTTPQSYLESKQVEVHSEGSLSEDSGHCLGVACYRRELLDADVRKQSPRQLTRAQIVELHNSLNDQYESQTLRWIARNPQRGSRRITSSQFRSQQDLLDFAKKHPGINIGITLVHDNYHMVQVFNVGGYLAVVDPNIREIMWGRFDEKSTKLFYATKDGKIRTQADEVCPPPRYWKDLDEPHAKE